MLLVRCMVFAFDNDIRPGEGGFHIALADLVPDADIGIAPLRVDARRIRLHGFGRIINGRQVLIFHADQVARFGGNRFRFGDNGCHPVAFTADDIALHPIRRSHSSGDGQG